MHHTTHLPFAIPLPSGIVTLSTDFGMRDSYAGTLKGVLLSINPHCRPVDLTHALPPQDIQAGSFHLAQSCPFFPQGTVHLAVVDPGVGSARRAMAVATEHFFFVGPDNGLFTAVMQEGTSFFCVELTDPAYFLSTVSATFHGRDIFAPVAAHLTRGESILNMGDPLYDPIMLDIPAPGREPDGSLHGTVIHIDQYGNLITNIPAAHIARLTREGAIRITCGSTVLHTLSPSYAQAETGQEPFGIIGSSGMLEISVKNSSAQQVIGAQRGDDVSVYAHSKARSKH